MFSQDFKEFLKLLNENSVEYMVVGGYAVGFHGFPRYTGDIDIWVNATISNAEKVLKTLDEFGFGNFNLSQEDFLIKKNLFQLGNPPFRIDILTSIDGVSFNETYRKKIVKIIDDVEINFIGLNELIKNKQASGRDKDLLDLKNLKK